MDPLSKYSALYWGRAVKVPGALHMEGCESDVETRDYFFRSQAISRPRPWSESVAATMYTLSQRGVPCWSYVFILLVCMSEYRRHQPGMGGVGVTGL